MPPQPLRQVVTRTVVPCLEEFVESFVRPSQPLLVRNCFEQLCDHWTVDALRQRLRGAAKHNEYDDEGRLLIPSPAGANFVARCHPDSTTVKELLQRRKEEDGASGGATADASSNSLQDDRYEGDGQMLIPQPPGVNYVSQYKSKEIELPTSKALDQFVQLSRGNDGSQQGCQCRLDPAVFWDPARDELPAMLQDDRFEIVYDNSFVWITSQSLRTSLHVSE